MTTKSTKWSIFLLQGNFKKIEKTYEPTPKWDHPVIPRIWTPKLYFTLTTNYAYVLQWFFFTFFSLNCFLDKALYWIVLDNINFLYMLLAPDCIYTCHPLPLFLEFPFHRTLWTIGTNSISILKLDRLKKWWKCQTGELNWKSNRDGYKKIFIL